MASNSDLERAAYAASLGLNDAQMAAMSLSALRAAFVAAGFGGGGGGSGNNGSIVYVWNGDSDFVLGPGQVDDGVKPRQFIGGSASPAVEVLNYVPRSGDVWIH